MPAVRITKVMPMATRPVIEIWRMTLNRLTEDRNRGSRTANTTIRTTRKINGANWPERSTARRSNVPGAGSPAVSLSFPVMPP